MSSPHFWPADAGLRVASRVWNRARWGVSSCTGRVWNRARTLWNQASSVHRKSKSYGSYPVETSEEANSRISNIFPSSFLAPFHSDKVENLGLSSIALIGVG